MRVDEICQPHNRELATYEPTNLFGARYVG